MKVRAAQMSYLFPVAVEATSNSRCDRRKASKPCGASMCARALYIRNSTYFVTVNEKLRDLLQHVFWTMSRREDNPPDPLGLDTMREQLSNILVPYLTGRTTSISHAFWMLVLLKWSSSESSNDSDATRQFLRWERCLKLVWAHYQPTSPEDSFSGIESARKQARDDGAPNQSYHRLLADPRAQGLLGSYLRPMRKLGLIQEDRLALTEIANLWTEGANMAPKLQNGNWNQWKNAFTSTYQANINVFRRHLHDRLRIKMPKLYVALESLGWPQEEAWHKASKWLEPSSSYALLAHDFCRWADRVRKVFDSLVFDGCTKILSWPTLNVTIPSELADSRWNKVRTFCTPEKVTVERLAEWHREEFEMRGRGESQLWLAYWGGRLDPRPHNGSPGRDRGGDCRWWNAVEMMKPVR